MTETPKTALELCMEAQQHAHTGQDTPRLQEVLLQLRVLLAGGPVAPAHPDVPTRPGVKPPELPGKPGVGVGGRHSA